jgi:hypothetical protein
MHEDLKSTILYYAALLDQTLNTLEEMRGEVCSTDFDNALAYLNESVDALREAADE